MRYEPGCAVAEYHIVEKLAAAPGNDELFRVENRGLHQTDLLRVVCRSVDDQRAAGSLKDSTRQAALHHPNIAKVREAFCHQGDLLVASEYIEGPTLRQLLDRPVAIPADLALSYARQLLSALAHAHSKGVYHGALCPEHIRITGANQIKLSGFRLASDFNNAVPSQPLHYLAPERFSTPNEPPTAQSDIYSCGVVLYELLTGRKLFDAPNAFQLRMLHAESVPLPPARLCENLPADADRAILCALAKKPHERFASATAFRDAFEGNQPPRRIPKAGLAVACMALVVVGGTGVGVSRYLNRPASPPTMPAVAIQQMPFPVGLYASAPEPAPRIVLKTPEEPVVQTPVAVEPAPSPLVQVPVRVQRQSAPPPPSRTLPPSPVGTPAPPTATAYTVDPPTPPPATPRPPLKAKIYGAIVDEPVLPARVAAPQPQPVEPQPAVATTASGPLPQPADDPQPVPAVAAAPAAAQPPSSVEAPQISITVNRAKPNQDKGFWRGLTNKVNPFRKREPGAKPSQ